MNQQYGYSETTKVHLHAEPVPLRADDYVGELKAVHLQHVEEDLPNHVRYAVVGVPKATVEPFG